MSDPQILTDEHRRMLLVEAGNLVDTSAQIREGLRVVLHMSGLGKPVVDDVIRLTDMLEGLAFERGRGLAVIDLGEKLNEGLSR